MNDWHIGIVLIVICVGQAWSVRRGRRAAVTYFLCVAPLSYFTVWNYGALDPFRICAAILLCGLGLKGQLARPARCLDGVAALWLYGVIVTLVGSCFWPTETIVSRSAVYSALRWAVQIANWTLTIGAGFVAGKTISEDVVFQRARRVVLLSALALCLYAVYQSAAYRLGLPLTASRWVGEDLQGQTSAETAALYVVNGESVFRPGSLFAEPKLLGTQCVLWLSLWVAGMAAGRSPKVRGGTVLLGLMAALWLTASTSAWTSCIGGLVVVAPAVLRGVARDQNARRWALVGLCIVGLALASAVLVGRAFDFDAARSVWTARVSERLGGTGTVISSALGDLAETETLGVIEENPLIGVFGAGLGGISFYIAQRLGGSSVVLFPNAGFLGFIANTGAIGLGILTALVWRSAVVPLWSRRRGTGEREVAVVGAMAFVQTLIFGSAGYPLFFLVTFIVASKLRRAARWQAGANRPEKCKYLPVSPLRWGVTR